LAPGYSSARQYQTMKIRRVGGFLEISFKLCGKTPMQQVATTTPCRGGASVPAEKRPAGPQIW
jgi:hypothetical protein